jgi:hypothetical protein
VPLRADGSPCRAFRSPGLRIAAPARLPEVSSQWRLSDGGSPLTVARQLRLCTGFPWCPAGILAFQRRLTGSSQSQIIRVLCGGHGKVKAVWRQGQLQIGWREARPGAAEHPRVPLA